MGLRKPHHINSDVRIFGKNYRKQGNKYIRIGDNMYIVDNKSAILNISQSDREQGELYFAKDISEYFQFINGVSDSDLIHLPNRRVYTYVLPTGDTMPIIVGNITLHKFIEIDYVLTKGNIVESGVIKCTNLNDTKINRQSQFDDAAILLSKSLDTNNIVITSSDIEPDTNDIEIVFSIKRLIL